MKIYSFCTQKLKLKLYSLNTYENCAHIFSRLSSVLEKSFYFILKKILPVSFQLGLSKASGRLTSIVPLKCIPFVLSEILRLTFHSKPEKLALIPLPGGLINFIVIFGSCKAKLRLPITMYLISQESIHKLGEAVVSHTTVGKCELSDCPV